MIVDNSVVSGVKLTQSLEECGLKSGSVVYVEELLSNNTWPSEAKVDKKGRKILTVSSDETFNGMATGLFNMGNTCYMNSAMQCLVNIRPIFEYYVKE